MVSVATLVALGMSVETGIHVVRNRRSGMIKNPAQIMYLRFFETRWRHEHSDYVAWASPEVVNLEKQLAHEVKHEKKDNKTGKLFGIVTLNLFTLKNTRTEILDCTVLAVSGPFPRNRPKWVIGKNDGQDRNVKFVVSDATDWHCLLRLSRPDCNDEELGVVVVKGGDQSLICVTSNPIISADGKMAGMLSCTCEMELVKPDK
jgi:hypothetical protein